MAKAQDRSERERRLAEALRRNLRRRKEAARDRPDVPSSGEEKP